MISGKCERTDIEEKVLERIRPRPDERERVSLALELVKSRVTEALEKASIPAKVRVEGSFARDTWLSGELDVDLFVLMPSDVCLGMISSGKVLSIIRKALADFEIEDRHAQHPYIRVRVDDVWVEVVPGCAVSSGSEALTAVDRTPFHTEYVKARLDEHMKDEVRLLKKFLKGVGVYGAEVAVRGFSGYLAELLIIAYGCFRSLLSQAAYVWRVPVVVDLIGAGRQDLLKKFKGAAMVVPDPVDPRRNAAAAVSQRSLAIFMLAARCYLENPSLEFFFPPETTLSPSDVVRAFSGRLSNVVLVEMVPPRKLPPDVLWGIAWRVARSISRGVRAWGFEPVDYSAYVDEASSKAWVAVEVLTNPLSEAEYHLGPPIWDRENVDKFLSKYLGGGALQGPWVDHEGRLVVVRRRRYVDLHTLIAERLGEWLPGSAKGFKVEVMGVDKAVYSMSVGALKWLRSFALKTPHWLRPRA